MSHQVKLGRMPFISSIIDPEKTEKTEEERELGKPPSQLSSLIRFAWKRGAVMLPLTLTASNSQ